ncbi:MAG: hypothetical protein HUU32_22630 [Calditrichaceae bacterium]|nr:hypothetical protein [Calditrichia bacterium]NUQ44191.1 hypothetical protein [Calditrichaceae bacterium]
MWQSHSLGALLSSIFNRQSSTVNRQSSTVNRQPSIVNRQSSIVNRQSSIVNRQPSIVNRQPSTVNRQSSIVNRQSSIVNRQPSIVNRQPSIVNRQSLTGTAPPRHLQAVEKQPAPGRGKFRLPPPGLQWFFAGNAGGVSYQLSAASFQVSPATRLQA